MAETYDFVICGGGTCGPVIAARLAEDPSVKILILEAGKDSKDMDTMHMPGAWTMNFDKETDFCIRTPPQKGLNGRVCPAPRGRFLGGSSGCNGTITVRGVKQDYDDWGAPEWSGDEMFRAMKKAEHYRPQDWFPHDQNSHGYDGHLNIEPARVPPLADLFFQSYQSKGLPYHPDMFSSGETANGCGHALRTTYKGIRATAADFITKDNKKPNITIMCDVTVDKVIIEKGSDGSLTAKGAEFEDNDGNKHKVFASKEVLLTSGSYGSPAILMRSGLGIKADLEALNIPCLVDIPGMGKNLQDHQLVFIYYELNRPGLTSDEQVHHDPNAVENGHKQWLKDKTGWLSTFPFGAFAFARLDERLKEENQEWRDMPRKPGRDPMDLTSTQPNLEFFHTICYGGPPEKQDFPKAGEYALAMCCFLCGLMGRGEVKLKSTNPRENPIVDHKYLEDRRDLMMMAEGARFANEIVHGDGVGEVIKGAWPRGAKHDKYTTNEEWQEWVKDHAATSYHPGGTCKMGTDDMAVVDPHLHVKGVKNLRVCDCSIMPLLNSGHTQMPAYGIAEIAAEMIKKEHGLK